MTRPKVRRYGPAYQSEEWRSRRLAREAPPPAADRDAEVWHLAICKDCQPVLPQPFRVEAERNIWRDAHASATGHDVLTATQQGSAPVPEPEPQRVFIQVEGQWHDIGYTDAAEFTYVIGSP